jgi:hypothetical protein
MAGRTYSNQSDRRLPVTVVSRKTGKPNPKGTRRLKESTALATGAEENDPHFLGKAANAAYRVFGSKDTARAVRLGHKIAERYEHPALQPSGKTLKKKKK